MARIPSHVLNARDIIDNADVRKLAGGVTRKTLLAWRAKDFPPPIRTTGGGVDLWDRQQVKRWLAARGN